MFTVLVPVQPAVFLPVTVYVVLVVGVVTTVAPTKFPGVQVYVLAPLPVNVIEAPAQAVGEEIVAVTEGTIPIFTFTVLVAVQPKVLVPVTVYCVVTVGDTTTVFPTNAPGFHV